jgi:glyoxylase-like metal-dependent hydrolase (beta-lactamase superfamily II)
MDYGIFDLENREDTMIRSATILICALLVLGGCSAGDAPVAEQATSLKLYVFDCGRLRFDTLAGFSVGDDETDVRDLSVPCYMVEHENGRLLWDGGLPSATAGADGMQVAGIGMQLDRTLAEQLKDLGLNMGSFDFMAFSHMHFDHVGVANEVEGATLLIQQSEYDAAFADPLTVLGFDPTLYDGLEFADRVLLDGDHDVFGDGKVRIISAPGHTPGHQVLFIDLENTGPVVLSGDLYHFAISREQKRVPEFNTDAEQTLESMNRVEALVDETGAQFWIEHELAWFEQLDKAPSHYD